MALNVQKLDPSPERQVLLGMLTARVVLGPIAVRWTEEGLFASKWANLVGGWAVSHYRRYDQAPKSSIEHYYRTWAETGDRETAEMVESLLVNLSDEMARLKAKLSPEHLLDIAGTLFEKVHIKRMLAKAEAWLEQGNIEKARHVIERSRKVELGLGAGIDVLTDDEAFRSALEELPESLIKYPDALGNFFADSLYRGAFVAFMGKAKIGKSYVLQDLAWQAVEQLNNVAYFELGDSCQPDVLQRFAARICQRPLKAGKRYQRPTWIETSGNRDLPQTRVERHETQAPLTVEEEKEARRLMAERVGPRRFKLSSHPSGSLSAAGIEAILETWARDDWRPDVLVCDYVDIMAAADSKMDKRDQVNQTWIGLRALSQKLRCLVLTATQIKAEGFDAWLLDRSHFAEDNRKYNHVTSMCGINQTDQEKEHGIYRLNWLLGRQLEFSEKKYVTVAGCVATGEPFLVSSF